MFGHSDSDGEYGVSDGEIDYQEDGDVFPFNIPQLLGYSDGENGESDGNIDN